jgi:hypothetical protein
LRRWFRPSAEITMRSEATMASLELRSDRFRISKFPESDEVT